MDFKLCRLCYEREGSVNIFQNENEVGILYKIIFCCKSVCVQKNDGLPFEVCSSCERDLHATYTFLLKCDATERRLRRLVQTQEQVSRHYLTKTEVKSEDYDTHFADETLISCEDLEPAAGDLQPRKHHTNQTEHITKKSYRKKVKLKQKDLICPVCNRRCASTSALLVHERIHTNEKPFQCPSCDKKYKDSGTLNRHIERNHIQHRERRFICENCGKGFYSKSDITVHMRVHTGETPYVCPICKARFTQISAMHRHKKRHMGDTNKNHECTICNKTFWTKDELKKHQSVHDETRHYSCHICNVQFKQKSNINKHMSIHYQPNRFICNHCGRTFNLKGNLKSHINRKHSEKSGYCSACCKNVSNIEIHMWRHTGQRPLKCEFCPSSFYEMKALALHINFKHKKTDKFKCKMTGCSLSFPSKPMMMYHIARFHEMHTPYPCDRCPRGFYRKNDLARHKIGTHKEKLL